MLEVVQTVCIIFCRAGLKADKQINKASYIFICRAKSH